MSPTNLVYLQLVERTFRDSMNFSNFRQRRAFHREAHISVFACGFDSFFQAPHCQEVVRGKPAHTSELEVRGGQ
jgi:hypothetical protein